MAIYKTQIKITKLQIKPKKQGATRFVALSSTTSYRPLLVFFLTLTLRLSNFLTLRLSNSLILSIHKS